MESFIFMEIEIFTEIVILIENVIFMNILMFKEIHEFFEFLFDDILPFFLEFCNNGSDQKKQRYSTRPTLQKPSKLSQKSTMN